MENKSVYYITNWDDAADYTNALEAMGIPHAVEDPTEGLSLSPGQLAIVIPDLDERKQDQVHKLFGSAGERYPG